MDTFARGLRDGFLHRRSISQLERQSDFAFYDWRIGLCLIASSEVDHQKLKDLTLWWAPRFHPSGSRSKLPPREFSALTNKQSCLSP
jgi:hypothetical protein